MYAEKICSISQCENGIFTFEKVTRHFLRSARQEVLNQGKNEAGKSSHITDGITVECGKICLEIGSDCPAYSVDYTQVISNSSNISAVCTENLKNVFVDVATVEQYANKAAISGNNSPLTGSLFQIGSK